MVYLSKACVETGLFPEVIPMSKFAVILYPDFSLQEITCLTSALSVRFEEKSILSQVKTGSVAAKRDCG